MDALTTHTHTHTHTSNQNALLNKLLHHENLGRQLSLIRNHKQFLTLDTQYNESNTTKKPNTRFHTQMKISVKGARVMEF